MLCRVSSCGTRQNLLCRVSNRKALGKEDSLSSARTRLSAKITAVSFRRPLTVLCREPLFAECPALGKEIFPECTADSPTLGKRRRYQEQNFTLPSKALGKNFLPTVRQKTLDRAPSTRKKSEFR